MKKICFCFQIHQPYRLRRYRFFDIGNEHYYSDDFQNEEIFQRIAEQCYLPANRLMLELLRQHPDFCISYAISGLAIEQMEYYKPEILESFRELIATGRVELVAEPYAHSLTALYDPTEWRAQILMHREKIKELFGLSPSRVLCNTELIYSDDIALAARQLGFEGVLTEGAKHILGWKSPGYLYSSSADNGLKLLMRNISVTDLITSDFGCYNSPNYPVTADKLLERVQHLPEGEEVACLYMNYEVLGAIHRRETGIFDFFRALPAMAEDYGIGFATPSQLLDTCKPVGQISVPVPVSGVGEERSTNQWLGNILQQGTVEKLQQWGERVRAVQDRRILQDWLYLQSADHLYYMDAQSSASGFSPYSSAYEAFNNYMNVLSDFLLRVDKQAPSTFETEELNSYQQTIKNQDELIASLQNQIAVLRAELAGLSAQSLSQESKPAVSSRATRKSKAEQKTKKE